MREAMGGALLIKLVMFFIVIYTCFLAIAINYSITFRVKNQIINLIEAYDGYEPAQEKIEEYVSGIGYYRKEASQMTKNNEACENNGVEGYCIAQIACDKDSSCRGTYWKVTTYVSFDFPFIGKITNFPVSGETRIIDNE